jgi:hypothetical protein
MFEKIEYTVKRIDGDYAYLQNDAVPEEDFKCAARALLLAEVGEGTRVAYEMLEYRVI